MADTDPRSIIEVAVPLPLDKTFHYLLPPELVHRDLSGRRVLVPFGSRRITAYVLGTAIQPSDPSGLKTVIEVLDEEPLWTERELEFFRWISAYYLHPLGEVLKTGLPTGINLQSRPGAQSGPLSGGKSIRRENIYRTTDAPLPARSLGAKAIQVLEFLRTRPETVTAEITGRFGDSSSQLRRLQELGLVCREQREVYRNPFGAEQVEPDSPRSLNPHQQLAYDRLRDAVDGRQFAPFLLHGVTGSGKTEVYLQAIAHCLAREAGALVLVPEISLTPQLVSRFRARFGDDIAILHSGLSDGERYDEWRRIRRGEIRIVIGARSAIFAPLERIGIIVVDEEHEASYKQSDGLRYNARDLALVRGQLEGATVLLGSATPLVTSLHTASQGRIELLELPERAGAGTLPQVEVVAMQGGGETSISPRLHRALEENLARGGQAMIFLNRRGFATFLVCTLCNQPLTCPNCSVTLTFHRSRRQSVCHYCDYAIPAPGVCPSCGGLELKDLGAGTERVEHELNELFPTARILRMDSDTTSGKGSHQRLLSPMREGTAQVLIGTQMITKGHDFPGVTLVGVIQGEASLNLPDFRSAERTFQVLSQVIGRAGRGDKQGLVLLQTRNPDHYAIRCAVSHDSAAFYREELEFRREAGYPPFSFLAAIAISGTSESAVEQRGNMSAALLSRIRHDLNLRVEILGPAPAPLYRLRGRFRRQILLKSPSRSHLRSLVTTWLVQRTPPSPTRESVDIDPVDML